MHGSFEMIAAPRTHNFPALGVPQQAVQPPAGPVSGGERNAWWQQLP